MPAPLRLAARSLLRAKTAAVINLVGLSAALASVVLIAVFVRHEFGIDRQAAHPERLYRLTYHAVRSGQTTAMATVGPPMGPSLQREFPEVEKFVRLRYTDPVMLRREGVDEAFYEDGAFYVDSTFFELFEFPLAAGDPRRALAEPNTVVLTPEIAAKYFGADDPVGKILLLDTVALRVTGVLRDDPVQSHLKFRLLISFPTFRVPFGYPVNLESWAWAGFYTYLQLKPGATKAAVEAKLPGFIAAKFDAERARLLSLSLQPWDEIYFHSGHLLNTDRQRTGNLAYVHGLAGVAGLILLIAAFNFMNMTLARSVSRSREVGVRKVLGATRGGLVRLFLAEALLLSFVALAVSVLLVEAGKRQLAGWLGWTLRFDALDWLAMLPACLGLALAAGLLAGLLPALTVSRFKALHVMKGALKTGKSSQALRKTLVGAQFVITTALLAGSLVVKRQMDFMRDKDLGFDQEQVLALHLQSPDFQEYYARLRDVLRNNPQVLGVSAGDVFDGTNGFQPVRIPGDAVGDAKQMNILGVHFDYFRTLGVEVVQGREFSAAFPADTARGVLLNETAVRQLGWEQPLGRRIQIGPLVPDGEVIGVVKDFHYSSLHDPIQPLAIFVPRTIMRHALVRVRPGHLPETLAALRADWDRAAPGFPFDVSFVDDRLAQRYAADHGFSRLLYLFSWVTIAITALGLYGLVAILVGFRIREIGIRKVLGASVATVSALLVRDFLKLVVVAVVIAVPLAWYALDGWLGAFAYRIRLEAWMFAVAGAAVVVVAALTAGARSVQAASADPVKSLRSE